MTTPFDNAPFADNPPQPKKLHDIPFHRHTPGPWELSEGNTSIWGKSPLNARVRLADIRKHSTMNGINSEANARLIAAAPELLSELCDSTADLTDCIEKLENVLPPDVLNGLWVQIERNRTVIAKAKGE